MTDLTIYDFDDEILARYRDAAARRGVSFNRLVCDVLADAAPATPLSVEEKLALVDRIRAMAPKGVVQTDSADIIRNMRDGGRASAGARHRPSRRGASAAQGERKR
jgi:hypothetical protein